MMGITLMNGIDDYPKKTEVTHPSPTRRTLEVFAQSQGPEHAVDLGDPARQRRLSGQRRQQTPAPGSLRTHGTSAKWPGAVHRIAGYAARGFGARGESRRWRRRERGAVGALHRSAALPDVLRAAVAMHDAVLDQKWPIRARSPR